jgi:hypothetical protein
VLYQLRYYYLGRVHYAASDHYPTLVMLAQALYEVTADVAELEIWSGRDLLWRDNAPVDRSA